MRTILITGCSSGFGLLTAMITTAHRQMDFEAYEQAMRQSLDWHD